MTEVKDKFWIWGHEAGSHNNGYEIKGSSRMTPAEGAFYLGVRNLVMVRYENKPAPPYDQHAIALRPLKRVVWSILGAGSCIDGSEEVTLIRDLAARYPNICGVIMDDFLQRRPTEDGVGAAYTPEQLSQIRKQLAIGNKKLDLWVVLYSHQVDLPIGKYLEQCDVVAYWTWRAKEIETLEQNFRRFEEVYPSCRKILGCYMYDYGDKKEMPVHLMEKQCRLGTRWLREGRIEGMIFLASCICDLGLEAVEWTRNWIAKT